MSDKCIFNEAAKAILGEVPADAEERIGHTVARAHLQGIIFNAEHVRAAQTRPDQVLATTLNKAFEFAKSPDLEEFPEKARAVMEAAAKRMRDRYEPMLKAA